MNTLPRDHPSFLERITEGSSTAPDGISLTKPQRPRRVEAHRLTYSLVVELELEMAYTVAGACQHARLPAQKPGCAGYL